MIKIEWVITFKETGELKEEGVRTFTKDSDSIKFLKQLDDRITKAAFKEIGEDWDGKISKVHKSNTGGVGDKNYGYVWRNHVSSYIYKARNLTDKGKQAAKASKYKMKIDISHE